MRVQILVQPVLNGEAAPSFQSVGHAEYKDHHIFDVAYEAGKHLFAAMSNLINEDNTGLVEDGWSFRVLITAVQRTGIEAAVCDE